LIIIITWGSRFEGPDAAHVHDREEKNDQMVSQVFQKATELYISQFVCCLSTSDGKKYTALSFRIQLVEGLFIKYASVSETWSVPGVAGIQQHSSTAD